MKRAENQQEDTGAVLIVEDCEEVHLAGMCLDGGAGAIRVTRVKRLKITDTRVSSEVRRPQ